MTGAPSIHEIMSAIQDSGYLMEQEVATHLERRGLHVFTNYAFEDPEESKSREIDVCALRRFYHDSDNLISGFVEFIVECKNNSNPFVFIARPKNLADIYRSPREFLFPFDYSMERSITANSSQRKDIPAFKHLQFDKIYEAHQKSWKAVQFCRIDRKGSGWHANHGGLYDATFYPMAKALMARQKDFRKVPNNDQFAHRHLWLWFPLVVTSGELFLIDSTEEEPHPTSVDHVTFQRELKSGKLSGTYSLTFVRQDALENYLKTVVDPLINHAHQILESKLEFLRTTELPWVDD